MVDALPRTPGGGADEPIAIVGAACRMPAARNLAEFWRFLLEGGDATRDMPPDRLDADLLFDPDPATPGRVCTRRGSFLDDIACFDAGFFGISPREARLMDPQHRLFLEVAWHALEDAGLPPEKLRDAVCSVFLGVYGYEYLHAVLNALGPEEIGPHHALGASHAAAVGRLSFFLEATGQSISVDTACSSSLVAVHLACQSLLSGESDVALVGGSSLMLSADPWIALSKSRMLSPDGRSKAFDASADGYGRGEGCAVVVLARQVDARVAGLPIRAAILGTASNQDGKSASLTAPSAQAQTRVIRAALARASLDPLSVGYLEAHGTGTRLGDPIEARAAAAALGRDAPDRTTLHLGSVKSNVGHLEAAAGIAGLIKAMLCVQHRTLVPSVHFRSGNPLIAWDDSSLEVPTKVTSWPSAFERAVAGVSSFGFSGTNAHVVLAEGAGGAKPPADSALPAILAVSARSSGALDRLVRDVAEADSPPDLSRLCAHSVHRRAHLERRCAVIVRPGDTLAGVEARLREVSPSRRIRAGPRVALLLTLHALEHWPLISSVACWGEAERWARALPIQQAAGASPDGTPAERALLLHAATAETLRRVGLAPSFAAGIGPAAQPARAICGEISWAEAARTAGACEPTDDTGRTDSLAREMLEGDVDVVLEVARGPMLRWLDQERDPKGGWNVSAFGTESALRFQDDLLDAIVGAYVLGATIQWDAVQHAPGPDRNWLSLYPFEQTRHWFEASDA